MQRRRVWPRWVSVVLMGLLCLMLLVAGTLVGLSRLRPRGAAISFTEDRWDAGTITNPQGSHVQHTFVFRNTGTSTLVITDIKAGCACTIPSVDGMKNTYAPGESGSITATLTLGAPGPKASTIVVLSNAAHGPSNLSMSATYAPDAYWVAIPQHLDLGEIASGRPATRELRIELLTRTKQDVGIVAVSSSTNAVKGAVTKTLSAAEISDHGLYNSTFYLSVSPALTALGQWTDTLTVKFTPDQVPSATIPVTGRILGNWKCEPESLICVWSTRDARPIDRLITVRNLAEQDFAVEEIINPFPDLLTINIGQPTDRSRTSVKISCTKRPPDPGASGVVTLHATCNGRQDVIQFPVVIRSW